MTTQRIRSGLRLACLAGLLAIAQAAIALEPLSPEPVTGEVVVEAFALDATPFAPDGMKTTVYLPPDYAAGTRRYPVLYVNDGQDRQAVQLRETLQKLIVAGEIRAPIVVAIDMPPDRMGAYGLSDRKAGTNLVAKTRFGGIGTNAHAYSEWLVRTLVPAIDARYRTRTTPDARAILGWSLGGLNAFNLGWQYPEVFGRVGAFSPSFWPASDTTDNASMQRTRMAQHMVDASEPRNGARWFFAVGTAEEAADRDGDGVDDAVDDARDMLVGWNADAGGMKGLRQLGYSINDDYGAKATRADASLYLLPGGKHEQVAWARMLPVFLRWAYAVHAPALDATGRVDSYQDVPSAHVPARTIDVWLPPSYATHPTRRYPVLYMHDGQNLFDPSMSFTGIDWDVDGTMTKLIQAHRVREAIVVAISNTPLRGNEYMPAKAASSEQRPYVPSDGYLRFIVEELKPAIDATYRTKPARGDTLVMGASMGGLISAYAMSEYPDVFGAAGGLSTHWPANDGAVIDYLATHLPARRSHRFYFDHGTATLDASYAPYQQRMDAVLRDAGWREDRDFMSRQFPGAEHNERAWRDRLEVPLQFLLGR
ncbi:alpha/beta hydrolase-fold protein [Lysobacter auxotrophicus]|uniref:Alpha/beta hydrolase-fold protein n=1 Tax=Lysobacter auxotrophicus TaxID=2992573 RepID=A0ABM8DI51_9GAMM|nr:alpha/beta hydrolase-fold protein [Lysobacter auxotrophicus]BDU18316.1 alpha/beta hydrolase-fold protein [Lysobacter auxotrophicus]